MSARVHYSGDMANDSGWFTADALPGGNFRLTENDGDRVFTVTPREIGNVYKGHCSPRFVTEDAYRAFYAAGRVKYRRI